MPPVQGRRCLSAVMSEQANPICELIRYSPFVWPYSAILPACLFVKEVCNWREGKQLGPTPSQTAMKLTVELITRTGELHRRNRTHPYLRPVFDDLLSSADGQTRFSIRSRTES